MLKKFLQELAELQITLNAYVEDGKLKLSMFRRASDSTYQLNWIVNETELVWPGSVEYSAMKALETFRIRLEDEQARDAEWLAGKDSGHAKP